MNILFFHGFSSHPESLQKTVDCLAKDGHYVVSPPMTSFSLQHGRHASAREWLQEAEVVLSEFASATEGDICLAGHSLGGAVCAHLLAGSRLQKECVNRIVKCAFLASPAGIDDHFLTFWKETSIDQLDWPFSLQVQMLSFLRRVDSLYPNISVPSIVLQGGNDVHIPPSSAAVLAESLGSSCHWYCMHPQADHFFPNGASAGARYLQNKVATFFRTSDHQ